MPGRRILLVEGTDDEHVIKHICGTRGIPHLDEIKSHYGVEDVLASFPVRLKESDVAILGVIVDADTDLGRRWQSLRDKLKNAGYENVPAKPNAEGTILDPPAGSLLPRVEVWIMPDNQTAGSLEVFLRFLVPTGSALFDHVESSVEKIPEGERRFRDEDTPKALIHTWLAWQKDPGTPFGQAITAKFLDSGVPQVDTLVSWLNGLYFS